MSEGRGAKSGGFLCTILIALAVLARAPGAPLHAQTRKEGIVPTPSSAFEQMPRPGMGEDGVAAILAVCGALKILPNDSLLKRDVRLSDSIIWHDETPSTRTDLGCNRAVLSLSDAYPREGFDMPLGLPWNRGAINSLLDALSKHPEDQRAADALALVALKARHTPKLSQIVRALGNAVHAGVRSRPTLRGCTDLAYHDDDSILVKYCANVAIGAGIDSTWHFLYLARMRFDAADTLGGQDLYFSAIAAASDSVVRAEMQWQFQWFLSPAEMKAWDKVSPDSGVKQVRYWLMKRDTRDGQPYGARIAEHFKRLRHSEKWFWIDPNPLSEWQMMGGKVLDEEGNVRFYNGRPYFRWQLEFDDRGVIWMRFGKPTREIALPSSENLMAEWVYQLSGQEMRLTFINETDTNKGILTGTASPTKLIGGPIKVATESDDNSIRVKNDIAIAAQFYRLWDPKTELPMALVGYSLRMKDLVKEDSTVKRITVDMTLQQWDPGLDRRDDSTVRRVLALPKKFDNNGIVVGTLTFPTTMGTTVWSVAAAQGTQAWGHNFEDNRPPITGGPFRMSDLVLGAESQKMSWTKGGEKIVLAPTGSFDLTKPVSLYFQTMTRAEYHDVTTIILIYTGSVARPGMMPRLKVAFDGEVAEGLSSVSRGLDVSRLTAGLYRFEVTMLTKDGTLLGKQSTLMRLR